MTKPLSEWEFSNRFWANVDKRGSCWLWKGKMTHKGYGAFFSRLNGETYWRAHRYCWALHNGSIPEGMMVIHFCDNRWCVNIDHLMLGTASDNNRDAMRKWRITKGEDVNTAKLTEAQVREIFDMPGTHTELGRRFGIHSSNVMKIKKGRNWKHLNLTRKANERTTE